MAKNIITFGLSDHDLGREEKGVTFYREIQEEGGQSRKGAMVVSKGGIRWYPKWKSKTNHFLTWDQFEVAAKDKGKKQK